MDRTQATEEIKARWRDLYPRDGRGRGKGIICPLCGSGSGHPKANGDPPTYDGIVENKKSKNKNALICFACHFSGSVIDLYMKEHNITEFRQAVDELASTLNITIDSDSSPRVRTERPKPAPVITEPAEPTDYTSYYRECQENLLESAEAKAYLQSRGISLDLALAFNVGFDPAWISPAVRQAQLQKGSNWLPDPKPVIILPSSAQHYVARDIRPASQLSDQEKKYQKMNVGSADIFGADLAFNSGKENIFVAEGAFDALAIMETRQFAIALNSTSNWELLIAKLEKEPTSATLILCLDNDKAGKNATQELKAGLQRLNISYVDADITGECKDPNEALVKDRAAFEAAVARAVSATAARPDNTIAYLDNLMAGEIDRFKQAQNRLTGFKNLDEKAGGLNAGLYVLAAASSLGKTTLALQMADQLAAAGHEVLFFSMEQSKLEMVSKSLSRLTAQADMKTAVTSLSIRRGYLPSQVTTAARKYKDLVDNRLSIIEGNFNCDIGYIGDYIRRYQQRNGIAPIVFIDYLQILQPAAAGKSKSSKKEEVDLAITELKRLSRELDLTIIVISSINRANYLTPFAFESLKESGQIEFTADVVWGLQLACLDEETFDKEGHIKAKRERISKAKAEIPRRIKFVCLKNRYGISSFDCSFAYYPQYDLFIPTEEPQAAMKAGRRL